MAFFGTSVGLYIGPQTVQLVQIAKMGGKIQLTNFVHIDIFADAQKTENVSYEDLVGNALKKAVHKAKIDLKRVNTVLMPGMVLLRYFQMPNISPEEMEEAVRFEARKYIPFRLEEAVSGFYILKDDPNSKKVGILSLVTKEESIKNHLVILGKVGISPMAVETASFGLLRLLEYNKELDKQKSNAVLYIYAQRVNIIILKNGVPLFVRDISMARKEEWIDDETAALLMASRQDMSNRQEHTLENMLSEFRISLEYYKKELGKEEISKIILCGEVDAFDELPSVQEAAQAAPEQSPFAAFLNHRFSVPVSIVDPLKYIVGPKEKPLPYTYPMLGVTLGAALRNITKSSVEIDLFRARKKTSLRAKIFLRKLIVSELFALVISFGIMYGLISMFVGRERNALQQAKQNRPKFVDLSFFTDEQLKTGEQQITARLSLYDLLTKNRTYLTHKLSMLAKLLPKDAWVRELETTNSLIVDNKNVKIQRRFYFSGNIFSMQKGLEIEMLNDFSEKLKNDPLFFEGFKVISTGPLTKGDYLNIPVMNFSLTCSSEPLEK